MVKRLTLILCLLAGGARATISVTHDTLLSQIPITTSDSNVSIGGTAVITVDATREFALWTQGAGTRLRFSNTGHTVTFGGLRNLGRIDTIGSTDAIEIKNRNLIAADSDFVCWGAGSVVMSGNAARTAAIRGVSVGGVMPTLMYRSTSGSFYLAGGTVSGFRHDFGSGYVGGLNLLPATNRTVSARDVFFSNITFDSCAVHIGRTQTLKGFRMENCLFNLSNTDGFIRTVSPNDTFYRVRVLHNHNSAAASGYGFLLDAGADSAYVYGCHVDPLGASGENTLDRGIQVNAPFVKMDRDTIHNCRFNILTTSSNARNTQLLNSVLYGASHEQLHWEAGTSDSNWVVTGNLIYGGGARSLVTVYRTGSAVMKNLNFSYNTVVSTGGGKSAFGWDCPAGTGCGSTATGLVFVGNIFAGANSSYALADMLLDGYTLTFTEFKKNVFDKLDTTRLGNNGDIITPYSITDSNTISSAFGFVDSANSDYRLSGTSPILNCGDNTYYTSIFGGANAPGDPGYYQSGTTGSCGGSSTPTGACCYNYTCAVVTQAQCTTSTGSGGLGGVYQGDGTTTCSNCTAPSTTRLFSHAKFAQMTYSGSTQTAATGTWLGQHADLTINPSATLYNAAITANANHKWIAYQTLSSLRGTDTTSLRTYATAKGWNADTLIIRANGSVSMEPPQAAGSPCVAGSCTTTVVNGRVVVCQWTTWRNYPDWNKPGAWYFTINKAISGSGNYGIMEDESQNNFYQGNLGATYTDSVTCPENPGITWPDEGSWCSGSPADAIGWSAYSTATLRRLRMLELHRTYIPQLVDSMNAHGLKIFSNQAAYGWGRSEIIQDMQRWGRSNLYGEGMLLAPTYNSYKATSWEFMDSVASWGPSKGGEATIWCYTNRQDSVSMPAGQRLKRIIHHNYCWYMMAASDYTYFTPIGNDPAANPPLYANDFKIADTATKWLDEFAVDLGPATGARSIVVAGTYPVYRRNFRYGSILYRPGAASVDMSDGSAVSVSLGRTMYRVNYDSSKQAASTTASIRVGDGAVLVDSTYFNQQSSTGQITIGDASVTEGGSMTFTVTLSAVQATTTTFSYATANGTATGGTDYTSTLGGKSIPIGQTSTTITIPTTNRSGCQASRNFTVTITNVSPITISIIDPTGTGTILDDDCGTTYGKTYKGKIVIKGKVKP